MIKRIFFLFLFCLISSSCEKKNSPEENLSKENFSSQPADTTITENSLYNLSGEWTDQSGREISLRQLAGKPRVAAMIYTSCQYACPTIVADIKKIRAKLPAEINSKIGYTLFSFDPERDTPERLKIAAKDMEIEDWTLLTSDEDDVQELAAAAEIQIKKMPDGEFSHSNVIFILNPQGEIVYRQEGLEMDPSASAEAIRKLVEGN